MTSSRSNLRSPGDGGQSPSSNGRVNNSNSSNNGDNNFQEFSSNLYSESVPVKRGQHYYELQRSAFEQKSEPQQQQQQQKQQQSNGQAKNQSTFRSNSQEELDKLLAGLDKLTETLPDLNSVRSYSSLSGSEKPLRDTSVNGVAESYNYKQTNNQQQQNDIYRPLSQQQQQQQQQQRDPSTPDRQFSLIR